MTVTKKWRRSGLRGDEPGGEVTTEKRERGEDKEDGQINRDSASECSVCVCVYVNRGGSAWNRRDRSTGLTRPRYPGNSTGELCSCSRLHGDWSMCVHECVCGGMGV